MQQSKRSQSIIFISRIMLRTVAMCTLAFSPMWFRAFSASYSVRGTLSYDLTYPDGQHKPSYQTFYLQVTNCFWELQVNLKNNPTIDHFTYTYDGKQILCYGSLRGKSEAVASGFIEPGPVPEVWSSGGEAFIWMAYASGCYFTSLTNDSARYLYGIVTQRTGKLRYDLPCTWKLSKAPPFLPKMVQYYQTNLVIRSHDGEILFKQILPDPFKHGYMCGRFSATKFTNIDGYMFPKEFEYRVLRPLPNTKTTNELPCVVFVKGTANAIRMRGKYAPVVPKRMYVQDLREERPGLTYFVTNGLIPRTNASIVRMARAVAQRKLTQDALVKMRQERMHKWREWLAVVLLLGMPVAYFLFSRRIRHRLQMKHNKIKSQNE